MWWSRRKIVYIDTRRLFFQIIVLAVVVCLLVSYWRWTRVTKVEFVSAELEASWVVAEKNLMVQICDELKGLSMVGQEPDLTGIELRITSMKEVKVYIVSDSGYILDRNKGTVLQTSEALKGIIEKAKRELRQKSPFGVMMSWKQVKTFIPVGQEFIIRDLDSGKKFKVRRTGGYSHADVEPLTQGDTAIIRELYAGIVSWKRRAVVAELNGNKIAASFTGAAEGNGQIKTNDVLGKMNLHFDEEDMAGGRNLSHRVMIWKAAGKTGQQIKTLNPEETIMVLFTGLDQRDNKILESVLDCKYTGNLNRIIGVTVFKLRRLENLNYSVTASVSLKGGPFNEKRNVLIKLSQNKNRGYKADPGFIKALLQ